MNITKCSKCDRSLIGEEANLHQCQEEVLDYKIKGNTLWMFNGQGWFPMDISRYQPTGNTNKTTDKVKEPVMRFCTICSTFS